MTNKEPHSLDKIRFSDCDMFGHLNNARYLDYMINAREDHLKQYYNFDFMEYYRNGLAWVISSHEIVYIRPAVYNEMVLIRSMLLSADTESLLIETVMLNGEQNHIKAVMRSKLVPVNIKTGKKEQHQPAFMDWANGLVNSEVDAREILQDRVKNLLAACRERKTNHQNTK